MGYLCLERSERNGLNIALTQEDLQAIGALLEPIRTDSKDMNERLKKVEITQENDVLTYL